MKGIGMARYHRSQSYLLFSVAWHVTRNGRDSVLFNPSLAFPEVTASVLRLTTSQHPTRVWNGVPEQKNENV